MNKAFIFLAITISLSIQQFWISSHPVTIKPYMIVIVIALFLSIFYLKDKVDIPISIYLLFFLICLLVFSSISSYNILLSLNRAIGGVGLIALLFCLFFYSSELDVKPRIIEKLMLVYCILSLLYYAFGLIHGFNIDEYLSGFDRGIYGLYLDGVLPRFRGFLDSPNNAVIIILAIIVYSMLYISKMSRLLTVLSLFILFLTFSFTGYMAVSFIILGYIVTKGIKPLTISLAITLISICILIYFYQTLPYFSSIVDARLARISTGSGRFELFSYSIGMISEKPILGYGLAQARVFLEGFQGRDLQSTHNSFIEVFFEGGVVNLFIYLLFWIFMTVDTIRSKIFWKDKILILSYVVSLFILNNGNNLIYVELMMFSLFWVYWLKRTKEYHYWSELTRL